MLHQEFLYVYTSLYMCLSLRSYSLMVNKLENSVAHWFLPSQKYVTLQSYLLLNISARDLQKHSLLSQAPYRCSNNSS